ncbi:protein S40-4-like [Phragmites australis]|uniref:protein S40-4-like n=1 Tax=Phragmites australis TaxID=29695 RepID=UPI002D773F64|nr:protein S40-4-like [Phragmites australis]
MARTTRSTATERAYLQFAPSPNGVVASPAEEFDESDIWGSFSQAVASDPRAPAESLRARPVPAAARPAGRQTKPVAVGRAGGAAHGSLPVNIPDWSKILGDEYRGRHDAGDWELDDADEDDVDAAAVPPHVLAWRRRAASLLAHEGAGVVGRTLKVRDAVWKRTTGFQD